MGRRINLLAVFGRLSKKQYTYIFPTSALNMCSHRTHLPAQSTTKPDLPGRTLPAQILKLIEDTRTHLKFRGPCALLRDNFARSRTPTHAPISPRHLQLVTTLANTQPPPRQCEETRMKANKSKQMNNRTIPLY